MKITVKRGCISIGTIDGVVETADFAVYEADLNSKYPGPIWIGSGGGKLTLSLTASERTLKTDPELDEPTEITFEGDEGTDLDGWCILAEGRRYSMYIALWNPKNEREVVYSYDN